MQTIVPYLTPSAVARRYAVDVHKVLAWIKSGQLQAIDASTTPGGRPRYRVDPADLAIFEAARSATPPPKPTRRRRKDPGITQYF